MQENNDRGGKQTEFVDTSFTIRRYCGTGELTVSARDGVHYRLDPGAGLHRRLRDCPAVPTRPWSSRSIGGMIVQCCPSLPGLLVVLVYL